MNASRELVTHRIGWVALWCTMVLVSGWPGNSSAQDGAQARELETLRSTVQGLEKSLQEVRAKLATLEGTNQPVPGTNLVAAAPTTQTNLPADQNYLMLAGQKIELAPTIYSLEMYGRSPIQDHDTFADQQPAAPRPDNKPIDPALKGFIQLPGTKTAIRFGGSARLDAIYDFEDNGNPNQFVPSTIPVAGQPDADTGGRSTVQAKGTRISFEARRPVGDTGSLRIYNENDFFNDSTSPNMSFRVRHFYGQAWNILIGQTFSTFMNIDAWPDVLDYAGPNAMVNRRQAQVRYSPSIYDGNGKMHLMFSIEQPNSDLSATATGVPVGAESASRTPDGVVGWRWEGGVGHVQMAGILRSLGYDAPNDTGQTVLGWGTSGSGAFNLFAKDKLLWQVAYGHGIARYINDIGGGTLDAAPDNSGELEAIPVFAAVLGYTHEWSPHFRSTASCGYLNVDPTDSLGALAIEKTTYTSVNLVWHPTTSFRMGLEYLYGSKDTLSGADGDGHRLNFVFRYDLIR